MVFDAELTRMVHELVLGNPLLEGGTMFFARFLPYVVVALFVLFALSAPARRTVKFFAATFGSAALSWVFVQIIKVFVARPRPSVLESMAALVPADGFSFPSGHAAFFFALAAATWRYDRQAGVLVAAAAVLISLARIAAGVHYVGDVVFGAMLGIIVGCLTGSLIIKIKPSLEAKV